MYEYAESSESAKGDDLDDETMDQEAKLRKLMAEKGINVEESDDEEED